MTSDLYGWLLRAFKSLEQNHGIQCWLVAASASKCHVSKVSAVCHQDLLKRNLSCFTCDFLKPVVNSGIHGRIDLLTAAKLKITPEK